jgi:hypothetical protein
VGILNPNGPTLCVLGSREFDGKYRTFMRWLHMLGGCTIYAAGTVNDLSYQGIFDDAMSIHEHLVQNHEHGLFHLIPSFLIANGGNETLADIAKHLLSNGAAQDDWGRQMAYTRQFGSNFFARAGAEIRSSYDDGLAAARAAGEEPSEFLKWIELRYGHLPEFKDAKIPSSTVTPMRPELLEEWCRIVSPRKFQTDALWAMKAMWDGAPMVLPEDMKAKAIRWNQVEQFLDRYGLTLPK